ncbi:MAG: prepilin-type N-terminal cleavage/methylation domain-containing protein [Candidatus Saccharibacteria bacterium]
MSNKLKELRAKEGFTIIEVIIVLVIGAVIMLAVFLVVPQLQRTQRNSSRQNSARRVETAGEQFAANNGGTYPASTITATDAAYCLNDGTTTLSTAAAKCTGITNITGDVKSPSNAFFTIISGIAPTADQMTISYNVNSCANNSTIAASLTNKFVVGVVQEGAGTTSTYYCVSN